MWTKQQIWTYSMLLGGLVFLALTLKLTFDFGLIVMFINAPVAIIGYFVHRMFMRTLAASREQAEQARRHVEELSHYIAEQERIGEVLEKSEEKFRNAFDHAAVGMALVAPSGRILKVNYSLCDLLGYTAAELLDLSFQSLMCKDDLYSFNVSLAKLFEGSNQKSQEEERVQHKQGHTIWLLRNASLVNYEADSSATAEAAEDSSHFVFQLQNITDRKHAEERLVHDALHDALTDLPNRVLFMDRLRVAFKRANRYPNYQFAVLFVDFDRFKLVNDSLGHHIGDELLIVIAQRLESSLRMSDTIARFGGDEFVMLVDEINDVAEAVKIAEDLQRNLAQPFNINGQEIVMTVSIGIARWTRECESPEFLLRDADTALYQAKRAGRARTEVFDLAMYERANHLLQLETDLRRALERDEFCVHYQPVVDLKTRDLMGFEALIRWQHPTRGLVPPMEFIPLAEETGMIESIGLWVLRESCRQLSEWRQRFAGFQDLWVSVNVSGRQFMQNDLVAQVNDILRSTGTPPHCLKLEVTESLMLENIELAVATMKQLKEFGIKLIIDDFGTGYSSLNHLHRLPLDFLKIDRSFVQNMSLCNENLEIINTIVVLAQTLNLQVIAEGIEDQEQIACLQKLGCQSGQGYYFARPLNPEMTESFLSERQQPTLLVEENLPQENFAGVIG